MIMRHGPNPIEPGERVEASPIAFGYARRRVPVRRFERVECKFDCAVDGTASREPRADLGRAVLSELQDHGRLVAVRMASRADNGCESGRDDFRGMEGDDE